jgi:putative membrane protein
LVSIVALEHIYIMILEMFMWTSPRALNAFGMTLELAEATVPMAANQGLYNGFLAAGLVWGLLHPNTIVGKQIQTFFVLCVVVAAIFGSITVQVSILLVQGLPALLALLSLWLWRPRASAHPVTMAEP